VAEGRSITVLVENTANQRGLLAEHGLALWIERGGRRILFDTGQGMALAHNADKLGIDLSAVNDVALSHGHYDHTGGLLAALSDFSRATVYAHLTALRDRFAQHPRNGARSVRSPIESFDWLRSRVGRIVLIGTRPVELGEGIWLTGQIPRRNDFEDTGGAFYFDQACTQADMIVDDQALYMETDDGLVVLLGCAHAGVVNTLDYVCTLTGENRMHAVCGGMHLLNANEHRLEQTIRKLRELDVQRIGLAHCTGFAAMARLHHELPNRCFHCVTGTRIEFD
jgi:7,8-dihydropterin-6-yl-methyl-4-(beta-D-ribofuranosyl)aminobenzene 5'-phosphate synthase